MRPQQEGSAGPGLERARALVPRTPFPGPGSSRAHGLQIALQANTTAVVLPHDGLQVSASPCPCALYAPHLQVECADHPRARLRHHCDKESPLQLEQRTALYHLAAFVGVLVLVALGGAALLYPGMQSGNSVPPWRPSAAGDTERQRGYLRWRHLSRDHLDERQPAGTPMDGKHAGRPCDSDPIWRQPRAWRVCDRVARWRDEHSCCYRAVPGGQSDGGNR